MKKILSIILVLVLGLSLLTGCGGNKDNNSSTNSNESADNSVDTTADTSSDAAATEQTSAPAHIIMTFLTGGTTPVDLQMVQDAINEISIAKINVEVEFKAVSIPETFSGTYSMWINSGEQIDLMGIAFQNPATFSTSGQIQKLNDLISANAPTITSLAEEFPIFDGSKIGEDIYGVTPVQNSYGYRGGLIMRQDYFDETGIETKDEYTYEEATQILAAIKEKHPDCYPFGTLGTGINGSQDAAGFFIEYDSLGATSQSGVLMDSTSSQIQDLYESEAYLNYLKLIRSWYEAGYIMPDAATSDSLISELCESGKIASYAMKTEPVQLLSPFTNEGWGTVAINLTDGFMPSISPAGNVYWTVPVTSADPAAAIKFLDLIYSDADVLHLINAGIEGVHYVKTDVEGVVDYPEGVTKDTATYANGFSIYGDRRNELTYGSSIPKEQYEAYTTNNVKKTYLSSGYAYDSTNMTNQLIAIGTVLNQYLPSLETGSVADVEGTYNEMVSQLKTAGIDDVIADNQAQFDKWLASKQ